MASFCCCCNYATVGHISIKFYNFLVSSVINAAHHSALTPHISRTYLPVCLINVGELELN